MNIGDNKIKILKNTLYCLGGNRIGCADLVFDHKIRQILPHEMPALCWRDIATASKWRQWQLQHRCTHFDAAKNVLDGHFLLLIPGAIDTHVHFNTPGFEDRDDFDHGSLAAAHGGVTTVVDMPCTSMPPVTCLANMQAKLTALRQRSWIDYGLWGGVRGNDLAEGKDLARQIRELAEAGVIGFKAYLISGMSTFTDLTPEQMLQVAQWIKPTGLPLAVHAEDKKRVQQRSLRLRNAGANDWRAYGKSRDSEAESRAVATMIAIARQTKCPIHIVHLSSALALEQVRQAQKEGLPVSAETCPHYLFFTQADFARPEISAYLKTAPPVKSGGDRAALWGGLADGTIAFVTTDHAGCDPEKEKSAENFWQVYGGIPGVEHRVPFLFSEGFLKHRLTLEQSINLLCTGPACFSHFDSKGRLAIGQDADFALVNLWEQQVIRAHEMHCKGKYTPFAGIPLNALVEKTILRGQIVMNRSGMVERKLGEGRFVARGE